MAAADVMNFQVRSGYQEVATVKHTMQQCNNTSKQTSLLGYCCIHNYILKTAAVERGGAT